MRIDRERLWANLIQLKEIGGSDDTSTGLRRGTAAVHDLALAPAQTNVIPSEAVLTVDLRNPDDDLMAAAKKHLAEFVDDLQHRHGVVATWERMAKTAVVPFHHEIQDVIAATAEPTPQVPSA